MARNNYRDWVIMSFGLESFQAKQKEESCRKLAQEIECCFHCLLAFFFSLFFVVVVVVVVVVVALSSPFFAFSFVHFLFSLSSTEETISCPNFFVCVVWLCYHQIYPCYSHFLQISIKSCRCISGNLGAFHADLDSLRESLPASFRPKSIWLHLSPFPVSWTALSFPYRLLQRSPSSCQRSKPARTIDASYGQRRSVRIEGKASASFSGWPLGGDRVSVRD